MFGPPVWAPRAPKGQNFIIFVFQRKTFKILLYAYFCTLISYELKIFGFGPPFGPLGPRKVKFVKFLFLMEDHQNFTVHWFWGLDFIYVQNLCFNPQGGLFWPPECQNRKKISYATPWILLHFEFWYHVCNVHWPDSVIHNRIELGSCMVQCMMVTCWHSTTLYSTMACESCYFCWLCNILSAQIQTQFPKHGVKIHLFTFKYYGVTQSNYPCLYILS